MKNSVNKREVLFHERVSYTNSFPLAAKYSWSTEFISRVVPRDSKRFQCTNLIPTSEYSSGRVIHFREVKLTGLHTASVTCNLQG
jgi:hypothetical protein